MKQIKNILLIDDDEADNDYHQIVIDKAGLNTIVSNFTDSRDALACWEKTCTNPEPAAYNLPELIFLDINMPAINGFELLEKVRNTPDPLNRKKQLKVFILSTAPPSDYQLSAQKYSDMVKGSYAKPLTAQILSDILQKHF